MTTDTAQVRPAGITGKLKNSGLLRLLVGVGYDPTNDTSLTGLLLVATLSLSLVSGYTTYSGMTEYLPHVSSVLVTFGVQLLLFVTSWHIGGAVNARRFSSSSLIIYLITMTVSVFFSYSSLVQKIHNEKRQKYDYRRFLSKEVANRVGNILENENKRVAPMTEDTFRQFRSWEARTATDIQQRVGVVKACLLRLKARQEAFEDKVVQEETKGGATGKASKPGRGDLYASLIDQRDKARSEYKIIKTVDARVERISRAYTQASTTAENAEMLSLHSLLSVQRACSEMASTLNAIAECNDRPNNTGVSLRPGTCSPPATLVARVTQMNGRVVGAWLSTFKLHCISLGSVRYRC